MTGNLIAICISPPLEEYLHAQNSQPGFMTWLHVPSSYTAATTREAPTERVVTFLLQIPQIPLESAKPPILENVLNA
jgi:hypothetical protein